MARTHDTGYLPVMSSSPPTAPSGSPAAPDPERLREIVVECLERVQSEGPTAIDDICRAHPGLESELRRRMQALGRLGLMPDNGAETGEFPELLGDFRLLERLGAGGMGVVYSAEQKSLGRRVAL